MAIIVEAPVTVDAVEAKTYNTFLVLGTNSRLNAATMTMRYTARVGLGKAIEGGYEVLQSSIKQIRIDDIFVEGTETEQTLVMAVADELVKRY